MELTSIQTVTNSHAVFGKDKLMSGKADELKGRVKEAIGDLTDNQKLKESGKADKAAGKVKQSVERAIDKVRDTIKKP